MEFSRRDGMISDPEFNVMDLWHKFAMKNFEHKIKPDLIRKFYRNFSSFMWHWSMLFLSQVFLKTESEIVAKRIRKRGRFEEQNIDMGFVDGINK